VSGDSSINLRATKSLASFTVSSSGTWYRDPPRQVFFPYLQSERAAQMAAYVRTDMGPEQMLPMPRAVVRRLDANRAAYQMKTTR
jgi:hypothetical protein